jgi:hypothetical protein
MTARLHLFGEGFVQTIFRMGELIATNEAEKRIFRLAAQDESRHLAFGVTHLKYLMDVNPERREELHHYLDLQEGALGQGQGGLTVNPATGEALAVLAGGGIDKMVGRIRCQAGRLSADRRCCPQPARFEPE